MTRRRKFQLGDIVVYDGRFAVVVDWRTRSFKSEYRIAEMNTMKRRYGPAIWRLSSTLEPTGQRSKTASILTYRANQYLDNELGGRGCDCECCIHTAAPTKDFLHTDGRLKEDE